MGVRNLGTLVMPRPSTACSETATSIVRGGSSLKVERAKLQGKETGKKMSK